MENDGIIATNAADVASEIDQGVFKGKYNEFALRVLPADDYPDPESSGNTVRINRIRVESGSSVVNGQVTRLGNQKLIYFYRTDDSNSILFPQESASTQVRIFDTDYFKDPATKDFGDYVPVYSTIAEGLPSDYTQYLITIVQTDSADPANTKQTVFESYRDWEDIVPFKAESAPVANEAVNFQYDLNFGQRSNGYWLACGGTTNTRVTDVQISKTISVHDKLLLPGGFAPSGAEWAQPIVTDGLFFKDIQWGDFQDFDKRAHIQDAYIDSGNNFYFIQRSNISRKLFRLLSGSPQLESKDIRTAIETPASLPACVNLGIKHILNFLFIHGTLGFLRLHDLSGDFRQDYRLVSWFANHPTTQTINDVYVWDHKVWIAGNTSLWYSDLGTFDPATSSFTEITLASYLTDSNGTSAIQRMSKLLRVRGNYRTDSSALTFSTDNLLRNPSFERGGQGNPPTYWTLQEDASGSSVALGSGAAAVDDNYYAVITKSAGSTHAALSQTVDADPSKSSRTFSVYAKTPNAGESVTLAVRSEDSAGATLATASETVAVTTAWTRFSVTLPTIAASAALLRAEASLTGAGAGHVVHLDAAQLESGSAPTPFTENFEYLLLGFVKVGGNMSDPPFALIDRDDPYNVHYPRGRYGNIARMNDATCVGANAVYFVDDTAVHNLTFLNNVDEYDRCSVMPLYAPSTADGHARVKKFETIAKVGDKVFYGGIVDNRVVRAEAVSSGAHAISFSSPSVGNSLLAIMGTNTVISDSAVSNTSIQFDRIDALHEGALSSSAAVGKYQPSTDYHFNVVLDGVATAVRVTSPAANNSPWTVDQIRNQINDYFNTISDTIDPSTNQHTKAQARWLETDRAALMGPEWYEISQSATETDGFYSTNGRNEVKLLRGNIHKVLFQEGNTSSFYVVKDSQIFKTRNDSNVLKNATTGHFNPHDWDISPSSYTLEAYKKVLNSEVVFTDDAYNRHAIPLGLDADCQILPSSVRVKTSAEAEVGFAVDEDFFVDYSLGTIIRSRGTNFLSNPQFDLGTTGWTAHASDLAPHFERVADITPFAANAARFYKTGSSPAILYQKATSASLNGGPHLNAGDTHVFSVYLKSNITASGAVRVLEYGAANENSFNDADFAGGSTSETSYALAGDNAWTRVIVAHTVVDSASTGLRVQIASGSASQILITKAQLERNTIVTPFVNGAKSTRIDPDMTVWVDFIECKTLAASVDYTFDGTGRQVKLLAEPDSNASYYLKYQYTKIFNPYIYSDTKPITTIIDMKDDDDYFLYEYQGQIWAINQIFALLSLDRGNPLFVSYNYHLPRVDQLKVRNEPDEYGNYLYLVKGSPDSLNPYKPIENGVSPTRYAGGVDLSGVTVTDWAPYNDSNADVLYEINVTTNDYSKNDVYDRRIFVDARSQTSFNISLFPETIAYFPFLKDFYATNGIMPLNLLKLSKIIPIIKNYDIVQNEEIGAWRTGYQVSLRNKPDMVFPSASFSIFVDPVGGNDSASGFTAGDAVKTVQRGVDLVTTSRPNVIINRQCIVGENVEVDKPFPVKIFAPEFCYWQGGLQNLTALSVQGVWFQNANCYPFADMRFFYCTFENASANCVYPQLVYFYNCEDMNCHNSIVRVKDTLFPSPFTFPYERFPLRDDGVVNTTNPEIATSDAESIAPGDVYYNAALATQPVGDYLFQHCLIHGSTDAVFQYDPSHDWTASVLFTYCTIANNYALVKTRATNLAISYDNSILWKNGQLIGDASFIFDTDSDIVFSNCFIDFSASADETDYNHGIGHLLGRADNTIGASDGADPQFVGAAGSVYDYHLRSLARGSSTDSPCLDRGTTGDLGCYSETRQQQAKYIPKKLRNYVAYIAEGVVYPITLNSEKVTITVEFKPTTSVSAPGVLLDTRASSDDEDFIALVYNNNVDNPSSQHMLTQDPTNSVANPYRFRVVVVNKERHYSIISPINIYTDEDFKKWHRISFTVNYEQIAAFNPKSTFTEQDTKQNIITLYHNDAVSKESFVVYDLSRFQDGTLMPGRGGVGTNAWDFNDICQFITLGSDFQNMNKMVGYYSELRIDNRLIDRKQFDLWNAKTVPFNDPMAYVHQAPLARAFDPKILNDYWSLKSQSDVGAKGGRFKEGSNKRLTYSQGEVAWGLFAPTSNLMGISALANAQVVAGRCIDWTTTHTVSKAWHLGTANSRFPSDNTAGIDVDLRHPDHSARVYTSQTEFVSALTAAFAAILNTDISFDFTPSGALRFFTRDFGATGLAGNLTLTANFGLPSDGTQFGFTAGPITNPRSVGGWEVLGLANANVASNNVWFTSDSAYTLLSSNAMVLSRGSLAFDGITAFKPMTLDVAKTYTLSVYVNCDGVLDGTRLNCHLNGDNVYWDSIERYLDKWWVCKKRISPSVATNSVGFTMPQHALGTLHVGAVQLEQAVFASPYVDIQTQDNGVLMLNRGLLNPRSGMIFFRFLPLFDHDDSSRERYLMECLTLNDDGTHDTSRLLRISYVYSPERARGILRFRLNSTLWELELVGTYWNQWHSVALSYDFNINHFQFKFDYFSNIIDQGEETFNFSDVYIGRAIPSIGRSNDDLTAADIYVRNVAVTNYQITDAELMNWTNADEFYSESLIVKTIDAYRADLLDTINTTNNFVSTANNLFTQMGALQNEVNQVSGEYAAANAGINALNNSVAADGAGISALNSASSNQGTQIAGIQATLEYMQDGNTGQWSTSTIGANLYDLHTGLTTAQANISGEVAARTTGDFAVRGDFSSTSVTLGAALVGIHDAANRFAATNAEGALAELAGSGRIPGGVNQTVADLANAFATLSGSIGGANTDISYLKDGNAIPSTWTQAHAQNDGWNVAAIRAEVNANAASITAISGQIAAIQLSDTAESTARQSADSAIMSSLASTALNQGASLVAIHDTATLYGASSVEGALAEIAGIGRNSTMSVAALYSIIGTDTTHGLQLTVSNLQSQASTNSGNIAANTVAINEMKDGSAGNGWSNPNWNLVQHENRISNAENNIVSLSGTESGLNTRVTALETSASNSQTLIGNEQQARTSADTTIRNDFASTAYAKGASLVGIEDAAHQIAATTVEGALAELRQGIGALAGALSWKDSVATKASLPLSGNSLGNARTVLDDGDGHAAQYVCIATAGSADQQWQKIADIDWGNATAIAFSSGSGLASANVGSALDEVNQKTFDRTKFAAAIASSAWAASGDLYCADLAHNLGTTEIAVMTTNSASGAILMVEEIERTDANHVRLFVSDNTLSLDVTVFGVVDRYSAVVSTWNVDGGGRYYADISHGFGTKKIMVSAFSMATSSMVMMDDIVFADDNTVRVYAADNGTPINVFVTKKAQMTAVKDISNWAISGDSYVATVQIGTGFDAVYAFFDPATARSVMLDEVSCANGVLALTKSDGTPVRLVVVQ